MGGAELGHVEWVWLGGGECRWVWEGPGGVGRISRGGVWLGRRIILVQRYSTKYKGN